MHCLCPSSLVSNPKWQLRGKFVLYCSMITTSYSDEGLSFEINNTEKANRIAFPSLICYYRMKQPWCSCFRSFCIKSVKFTTQGTLLVGDLTAATTTLRIALNSFCSPFFFLLLLWENCSLYFCCWDYSSAAWRLAPSSLVIGAFLCLFKGKKTGRYFIPVPKVLLSISCERGWK